MCKKEGKKRKVCLKKPMTFIDIHCKIIHYNLVLTLSHCVTFFFMYFYKDKRLKVVSQGHTAHKLGILIQAQVA
jgi:hypothetical protein